MFYGRGILKVVQVVSTWGNRKAKSMGMGTDGRIKKQLLKYEHIMRRIQHCPYSPEPKKYGAKAQSLLPQDNSRKLTKKNQTGAENCRKHPVLCESSGYDRFNGVEFDCQQANERIKTYLRKIIPSPRLFSIAPGCRGMIPSIRYGIKHPF